MCNINMSSNNSFSFMPLLLEAVAINDVNKNVGSKPAVFIQGRFQPISKAHADIINRMIEEYPECEHFVFIVKGLTTSENKESNPFDFETQKILIKKSCPLIGNNIIEVTDGFIGTFINELRNKDFEPKAFYCGTDRVKTYTEQLNRYSEKLNVNIDINEIPRTDVDISATKIRKSIKENDFDSFKSMTKNLTIKEFNMLRKVMNSNG